ncbi:MAG: ribonuclease Z [Bacteroidota bacterium]
MHFELTILGCNSAVPAHNRFPSAQVLQVQEHAYLIDCGEGTQMRMLQYNIRKSKINAIFISHLHGDHVYGLIGLLNSYNLASRKAPLKVFAPPGLEEIINVHLKYSAHPFTYPVDFVTTDVERAQQVYEDEGITVETIPLQHRVPTNGYLFREKQRPPNIRPEQLKVYDIHYSKIPAIKAGEDLLLDDGRRIPNHELIFLAPPPRSFAYCSDTLYTESIIDQIKGVSLLYHESTFMHEVLELAKQTMHSTAHQAATIAHKAQVGQLILGHYSSRYQDLSPLLAEARAVFPNSELGEGGRRYTVALEKRS